MFSLISDVGSVGLRIFDHGKSFAREPPEGNRKQQTLEVLC